VLDSLNDGHVLPIVGMSKIRRPPKDPAVLLALTLGLGLFATGMVYMSLESMGVAVVFFGLAVVMTWFT
jgi:hypothetical protein